ncbi:MAG: hypothetical protein JXQ27_13340 [Acidobacteria bacterium]|nr:hypothetical protein [Acidobacteriota bacterium]
MGPRIRTWLLITIVGGGLSVACGVHHAGSDPPAGRLGGPCRYDTFAGTAVITRVERTAASTAQAEAAGGPGYAGYAVYFRFEAAGELPVDAAPLAGEHFWQLRNSWYPGQCYLDKYDLRPDRRFPAAARLLRQGACTPVLFELAGLDAADYFESRAAGVTGTIRIVYDVGGLNTLVIEDQFCRYTHAVYKGTNPVAAGTLADYEKTTTTGTITPAVIAHLIRVFRENEFWRLPAELGDLAPGERYYAHRITITLGGHRKTVTFKSNPRLTTPPAFRAVEEGLRQVIRDQFGY